MNYYEHHIGDYDKNTSHLTACEDGIYSRMIRRYYDKEVPLPVDVEQVKRLMRARTKEEKQAVVDVLAEFFILQDDGYHQKVCDEVLENFRAGEPEREVKKANEDNRLKRHRAERSDLFKIVTDAGEHAPWNIGMTELRDMAKRLQKQKPETPLLPEPETLPATATATPATATQTPITSPQSPLVLIPKEPNGSLSPAKLPTCPTQAVVDLYHEVLPELPSVRLVNPVRTKAIASLWKFVLTTNTPEGLPRATSAAEALAWIRTYFERARVNDFLMGRGQKSADHVGWECDIDFLMSQKGMKQVIEKTRNT